MLLFSVENVRLIHMKALSDDFLIPYRSKYFILFFWPFRFFILFLQLPYQHHSLKGFRQVGQTYIRRRISRFAFDLSKS